LQTIYKDFSNIVRERKKEFVGAFQKLNITNVGDMIKDSVIVNQIAPVTLKDFSSDNLRKDRLQRQSLNANGGDRSIFYRDVALVRYKDESVQVVGDAGFMNTFLKRANDDFWKTIGCI
jgi:hypothetical protein